MDSTLTTTMWLALVHCGKIRLLGRKGQRVEKDVLGLCQNVTMWSPEINEKSIAYGPSGVGVGINDRYQALLMIYTILLALPFLHPSCYIPCHDSTPTSLCLSTCCYLCRDSPPSCARLAKSYLALWLLQVSLDLDSLLPLTRARFMGL